MKPSLLQAFWEGVRDVCHSKRQTRAPLAVSTAPTQGPKLVAEIAQSLEVDAFYDWAGGLFGLLSHRDAPNAGHDVIRPLIACPWWPWNNNAGGAERARGGGGF